MTNIDKSDFKDKVLAECIREIENDSPARLLGEAQDRNASFLSLVNLRAQKIKNQLNLSPLLQQFYTSKQVVIYSFAITFFIIGLFSVQNVFFAEGNTQVNFFWSFALFFIPNLFSLFVWGFLFIKKNALNQAWLGTFFRFILLKTKRFSKSENINDSHVFAIYKTALKITFSGAIGRFQLSYLTHLIWFFYFLGAIIILLIKLATHQVDFMWETSLLSSDAFTGLTQLLSSVPSLLGFSVPSAVQIQQSHLGNTNLAVDAENLRMAWSSLLIVSLVIYGLLPRLLLLIIMRWRLNVAQASFTLNPAHSYYLQLRQHIKPNVTQLGVVDADEHAEAFKQTSQKSIDDGIFPKQFYPVFLELSSKEFETLALQLSKKEDLLCHDFINLCDYESQTKLIGNIEQIKPHDIVLYIGLSRLPDRGVLSLIKKIKAASESHCYLVLVIDSANDPQSTRYKQRNQDWYKLANSVNIPFENVSHLAISEASQ